MEEKEIKEIAEIIKVQRIAINKLRLFSGCDIAIDSLDKIKNRLSDYFEREDQKRVDLMPIHHIHKFNKKQFKEWCGDKE